jgi:catechol 2,3-dioxygenase
VQNLLVFPERSLIMATSDASLEIDHVALTVRDLAKVRDFYRSALGMQLISSDAETAVLGAGNQPLLTLQRDTAARAPARRSAGLFHTAFLLPDRADLARWMRHGIDSRLPLQGASDHGVSEAIYLADPEGNGIEIYIDRPRDVWPRAGAGVDMKTEALDLAALNTAGSGTFTAMPDGSVIGHVHLQVGGLEASDAFWRDQIGMTVMQSYPGASFYGASGYHHHIAGNIWNSRGAGVRSTGETGLAGLTLRAEAATLAAIAARSSAAAAGFTLTDPWGTPITLTQKAG